MEICERASRMKLRFPTLVGDITTEQLWDLPLTGRANQPDLDKTARAVNTALKSVTEESFVDIKPNPLKVQLELALEIVKHVIAAKVAAAEAAKKAMETSQRKQKLLAALAAKEDIELTGKSRAELEAEIAAMA